MGSGRLSPSLTLPWVLGSFSWGALSYIGGLFVGFGWGRSLKPAPSLLPRKPAGGPLSPEILWKPLVPPTLTIEHLLDGQAGSSLSGPAPWLPYRQTDHGGVLPRIGASGRGRGGAGRRCRLPPGQCPTCWEWAELRCWAATPWPWRGRLAWPTDMDSTAGLGRWDHLRLHLPPPLRLVGSAVAARPQMPHLCPSACSFTRQGHQPPG